MPMSWRNSLQALYDAGVIGFAADVELAWAFVRANSSSKTQFKDAFPVHHALLHKPKSLSERLEEARRSYKEESSA